MDTMTAFMFGIPTGIFLTLVFLAIVGRGGEEDSHRKM